MTENSNTTPPSDEIERLTETEWEQRRARRECAAYGHDWQIISTMTGPIALRCERACGDLGYSVVRSNRPGATTKETP